MSCKDLAFHGFCPKRKNRGWRPVQFVLLATGVILAAAAQQPRWSPDIPKTWDEAALKDWATPLAGLNARPTHMTAARYYALPVDNLKTYPVYVEGKEPPGLALHTRKGTGFYKVPSLKGVWYRGHYLHDGSVASLEEMFDPDRLKDTHAPGGFTPPDKPQRAIKGHEFGLKLDPEERKQLIAFLRTL